MNIEHLAKRLQDLECGDIGKSIFAVEIPASCHEGILLMGQYSGVPVDPYLPNFYKAEVQIVVRSVDHLRGRNLARKAAEAMATDTGYTVETMEVRLARQLNLPRPYRRSVGGYWEFEVDMEIHFHDASA